MVKGTEAYCLFSVARSLLPPTPGDAHALLFSQPVSQGHRKWLPLRPSGQINTFSWPAPWSRQKFHLQRMEVLPLGEKVPA
jgi:hypothetical protein